MSIYVLYSFATDVTGENIVKGLGVKGGKELPRNLKKGDIVISWGSKLPKEFDKSSLSGIKTINDPLKIKNAANKLASLKLLDKAGVPVPKFSEASSIKKDMASGKMKFPVIGRKKRHQGGRGFWLCVQDVDVDNALSEGAEYFIQHIPNKTEYRIHVFGRDVIVAQKKVHQGNPQRNWINDQIEQMKKKAEKSDSVMPNESATKAALKLMLEKRQVEIPDPLIRSNHRGWKLSTITKVNTPTKTNAVKAVKGLGLDFGAVDCIVGDDGNSYILEVNTGPGLTEGTLGKYLDAFKKIIGSTPKSKSNLFGSKLKPISEAAPVEDLALSLGSDDFMEALGEVENDEEALAVVRFARRLAKKRRSR